MELQFEANQQFQLDAIRSTIELLKGQPRNDPSSLVSRGLHAGRTSAGGERSERGLGNRLVIDDETLCRNLRDIQYRNDIEIAAGVPFEGWTIYDTPAGRHRFCPQFSLEMETGTGKTYVYLRTICELAATYGFTKFVIVVPNVAIREGVLKNIGITAEHLRRIYDVVPESFVYDPKRVERLRHFAAATMIQIVVINIDAFRTALRGNDGERKRNVIYKESDKLGGRPIEFLQAARPIVVIDEPQSVDNTEGARAAIATLNPLFILRYSATHRQRYNLIYRLDPIAAFELGLVKQIEVANASPDGPGTDAFVAVETIERVPQIRAKVRIDVQTAAGPRRKTVTVRCGDDLFIRGNERAAYRHGYQVAEIGAEPGTEFIRFANGTTVRLGARIGRMRDDVWRVQIRHTVRRHLDRALELQSRRVKVLSLFFIDRVANYRDYDAAGKAVAGKFALALEAELATLAREERYRSLSWLNEPPQRLHGGYFAGDRNHRLKDTSGVTAADDESYRLIMKEKERLLSADEPLRFIFSHSALREGWDNPNVFQICTLNEGRSALKKRQEIGRGLRLAVDADGRRIFDASVNKLYVMANESYEQFARSLQTEYEDEWGITFGKVPLRAIARFAPAAAQRLFDALVAQKMLEVDGRIGASFAPGRPNFSLALPAEFAELNTALIDLLSSYRLERHVRGESRERHSRFDRQVLPRESAELRTRSGAKTADRIDFDTETLVAGASYTIRQMPAIAPPSARIVSGSLRPIRAGVAVSALSSTEESVAAERHAVPDILAYLQAQTRLTRATIFRVLRDSERLADYFIHPQSYLDAVAAIMNAELDKCIRAGLKDNRPPGAGHGPE